MSGHVVKEKLLGGFDVFYNCASCAADLRSPLTDAGERETCPQCSARYVVPGERERAEYKRRQEAKRQKQREREQKRREQQKRTEDEAAAAAHATEDHQPSVKRDPAARLDRVEPHEIPAYRGMAFVVRLLQILAILLIVLPILIMLVGLIQPAVFFIGFASLPGCVIMAVVGAVSAETLKAFRDHVQNSWHTRRTLAQIAERMEQTRHADDSA